MLMLPLNISASLQRQREKGTRNGTKPTNQNHPRSIGDVFRLVCGGAGFGRRALAGCRGPMCNPLRRVGRRRDTRASASYGEPDSAAKGGSIKRPPRAVDTALGQPERRNRHGYRLIRRLAGGHANRRRAEEPSLSEPEIINPAFITGVAVDADDYAVRIIGWALHPATWNGTAERRKIIDFVMPTPVARALKEKLNRKLKTGY
jgi:hypothetical protein